MKKRMIFVGLMLVACGVVLQAMEKKLNLQAAIYYNDIKRIDEILKSDEKKVNGDGKILIPLVLAVSNNRPDVVEFLLKSYPATHKYILKAFEEEFTVTGRISTKNLNIIKLLLAYGCPKYIDINKPDQSGRTYLHTIAAKNSNFNSLSDDQMKKLTKLLLDFGAKPSLDIRDTYEKKTPLELAKENKNQAFIDAVTEWEHYQLILQLKKKDFYDVKFKFDETSKTEKMTTPSTSTSTTTEMAKPLQWENLSKKEQNELTQTQKEWYEEID